MYCDFQYVGDQEDKQWLFESRIMTTAGGKAFLVFAEDIRDILRNDDPNVRRGVVTGAKEFTIPGFMLEKVRAAAERSGGGSETRSQTGSTVSSNVSQNSPAPTEEDMEPESEGDSTPPPHAAQTNAMHFMGTHTAVGSRRSIAFKARRLFVDACNAWFCAALCARLCFLRAKGL